MLEYIKGWVINICTAVFFITAVEMILPNNKMKKYAKFVLGLILITIIINPLIKIFDKSFNIDSYTEKACEYFENKDYKNDYEKYKTNTIDNTVKAFSKNLEKTCLSKLKEKFPKDSYEVSVDASFDEKKEKFIINLVNVGFSDKKVRKVKKITVGDKNKAKKPEMEDTKKSNEIKEYISSIIGVSKNKIKIYRIE